MNNSNCITIGDKQIPVGTFIEKIKSDIALLQDQLWNLEKQAYPKRDSIDKTRELLKKRKAALLWAQRHQAESMTADCASEPV